LLLRYFAAAHLYCEVECPEVLDGEILGHARLWMRGEHHADIRLDGDGRLAVAHCPAKALLVGWRLARQERGEVFYQAWMHG
jgi:ferredoxin